MKIFIYSVLILLLLASCNRKFYSKTSQPNCGALETNYAVDSFGNFLGKDDVKFFLNGRHFLFRDGYLVEVIYTVNFPTMYKNDTMVTRDSSFYYFVDLRSKKFYKYNNFIDTATLVDYYQYPNKNIVGSDLFINSVIGQTPSNFKNYRDTTIKNYSYRICETSYTEPDSLSTANKDLRYDTVLFKSYILKGNSLPFYLSRSSFADGFTGQTTVVDRYYKKSKSFQRMEVKILRDTLTSKEEKVFAAWEKYAKEHP